MKSKISFFNRGISRNFLRRFWPLWAVYLGILLLLVPGTLGSQAEAIRNGSQGYLDADLVELGQGLVYFSAAVGVVTAMAMFHYLYQTRSCGLMNMLPVRRETMFCTVWLTGLVPLLLSDLLVLLLTAALYCRPGFVSLRALLDWLALVAMGNVTFYGFAVFCAMLTGNLLVLPAVYVVLNFTAVVAEDSARYLLSTFVYGMQNGGLTLDFLSPLVRLWRRLHISADYGQRFYTVEGLGTLAAYCAAGLLLSAAALLLYRRRRMESATDVVAIPVLKPVFKYCLSFGTALVFAGLVDTLFLDLGIDTGANAWIVLLLMLGGAFLGYFAAEMMMQKTLRVFRGRWRGFAVACAVLVLFVCAFEFDLFGFEKRVPAAGEVESVSVSCMDGHAEMSTPEDIAAAQDLHRALLSGKAACEQKGGSYYVTLDYRLKNGRVLSRGYHVPVPGAAEPDSFARQTEALLNRPSALLARVTPTLSVDRSTVRLAQVQFGHWVELSEGEHFAYGAYELTKDEALSLYREGILPDAQAEHIARVHLVTDQAYYETAYPLTVRMDLRAPGGGYRSYSFIIVEVEADSVNTLRWLREHTDLELKTYAEWGYGEDGLYSPAQRGEVPLEARQG